MSTDSPLPEYQYGGARAMVELHAHHLRDFWNAWQEAKAQDLKLPATGDPDYASLEALLHHVLRAARGYMVWMCEQLELPDPAINPPPGVDEVEAGAAAYIEHVLHQWRTPLAGVPEKAFEDKEYPSRWKTLYCIDAMMEHAVMHPIRHAFQIRNSCSEAARNRAP